MKGAMAGISFVLGVLSLASAQVARGGLTADLPQELSSSLQRIQSGCERGGLKGFARIYRQERKRILSAAHELGDDGVEKELEREKGEKGAGPLASALVEVAPEALPSDHPLRGELVENSKTLEKALSGSKSAARGWSLKTRALYADHRPRTTEAILHCVERSFHLAAED